MSILVESTSTEPVDLNQGVESDPKPQEKEGKPQEGNTSAIPDKFKDKTVEEVASAYTNLESELGRLRNELGNYRSMTDRFLSLEEKRMEDLGNGKAKDEFKLDPTEFLSNPSEALDKYYEHRRGQDQEYRQLQERLDRIEGNIGQNTLAQKHPDTNEIVNNPEFQQWIQGNGYRTRIAAQAVQNQDADALDYLLTEWKERHQSSGGNGSDTQDSEIRRAQRASTESASSGATGNTAKRFSRRKLVELKIRNPEEYTARSDEILKAYAEGRVDD